MLQKGWLYLPSFSFGASGALSGVFSAAFSFSVAAGGVGGLVGLAGSQPTTHRAVNNVTIAPNFIIPWISHSKNKKQRRCSCGHRTGLAATTYSIRPCLSCRTGRESSARLRRNTLDRLALDASRGPIRTAPSGRHCRPDGADMIAPPSWGGQNPHSRILSVPRIKPANWEESAGLRGKLGLSAGLLARTLRKIGLNYASDVRRSR